MEVSVHLIFNSLRFSWNPRRMQAMALSAAVTVGTASAQVVKAPRYQGPVDTPQPRLNLPALPAPLTPNGTVVEDIVVRVNDQIISRSDVERAEEQLQQDSTQANVPAGEAALRQKDMLRDMIDQQLLLSRAKELGLNADAEVIRQLDEIRKQNKMDSLDDLERAARQQGVNFEDFKAKIRNQVLQQQVVRDEVGRRIQLSQADETKYYQDHLKDFEQPEQIRLSEILVPLPENASLDQIQQAEAKANGLKTQVMQGGDFADLAKKNSGGPSAAQGGELGLFKRGALAQVLEDQTFSLKAGESTQPIRTRQGFVILRVTEHDVAGPAPLKDVEPQIQEAIYVSQMQPAMRAYLTKLRNDSYVDVAPGFVDSGATGSETKPIFSAYTPPAVKKKAVKSKSRFDRGTGFSTAPKQAVVASPDTTGTRTITGPDAKPAIDARTGLATIAAPKPVSGKGVKHAKREKIRYGQAPRNALPGDANDTPTPTTDGGVVASAGGSPAQPAPVESANLADNPLTPAAPDQKKTRFAAKAAEVKQQKVKTQGAKQAEKTLATPTPVTSEEKASLKTQSAPLGVAGVDQSKKQKKPKRAKGTPKERLQEKPVEKPAPPPPVDQTVNPALAPTSATPPSTKQPAATTPAATPPATTPPGF